MSREILLPEVITVRLPAGTLTALDALCKTAERRADVARAILVGGVAESPAPDAAGSRYRPRRAGATTGTTPHD
jgi:hypothetical protein